MAKRDEILATLDRWRNSGKSRTAFARDEGISINTFHYWCLKNDPSKQDKQKSKPAPLAVTPIIIALVGLVSMQEVRIDLIQLESSDGAQDLQFLPGDSTAWVAGGSGIRSIHLSTGEVSRRFITGGTVYNLGLDSAKQRLVSAHDDGTARIWNLAADREPRRDTTELATIASASDEAAPVRGERRLLSVTSLDDIVTVDVKLDGAPPLKFYVVDIHGRIVRAHDRQSMTSGRHRLTFDVASLPAGSYYVVLHSGGAFEQHAVVIL